MRKRIFLAVKIKGRGGGACEIAHSRCATGWIKSINLPNFHVVDTLSLTTTLIPAAPGSKGSSNDWENEIHLNRQGYEKLATTWSPAIAQVG